MSDFDWKWFTGFFEGEGTFVVSSFIRKFGRYKGNLYIGVALEICNTDNDLINYIHSQFKNSSVYKRRRSKRHKSISTVYICGQQNVLDTLTKMLPHFKSSYNKKMATLLIRYIKSRLSKDSFHSHYSQYEISIIKEILKMKKPNRDLSFLDEYKPSGFWKN